MVINTEPNNLPKYLQKAQGQVKKHYLAWAEDLQLAAFTFYEPVLMEEVILEGFF